LIAGVLVVSALAAGLVERAPLSLPMLFLGLGFVVGNRGLGLISISIDSPVLEVVAIVTLALVLPPRRPVARTTVLTVLRGQR
jgi:NhaP-type Na+/H+ and K+/H+ antiporter